jgi:hypothetical protein
MVAFNWPQSMLYYIYEAFGMLSICSLDLLLTRQDPNYHSESFKINHCHFSKSNNMILCNQNSLGNVQRQNITLSPASSHQTFTQKHIHVKSGATCLCFEAARPVADSGDSITQGSQESGPENTYCLETYQRSREVPVHQDQKGQASSLAYRF